VDHESYAIPTNLFRSVKNRQFEEATSIFIIFSFPQTSPTFKEYLKKKSGEKSEEKYKKKRPFSNF